MTNSPIASRPFSYLDDITHESRYIEKLADDCRALIEDRFTESIADGDIIDANEPNWGEDHEMDKYIADREDRIVAMVIRCLKGE